LTNRLVVRKEPGEGKGTSNDSTCESSKEQERNGRTIGGYIVIGVLDYYKGESGKEDP